MLYIKKLRARHCLMRHRDRGLKPLAHKPHYTKSGGQPAIGMFGASTGSGGKAPTGYGGAGSKGFVRRASLGPVGRPPPGMVGQAPMGLFGHSLGPVEGPTRYGGVGSSRTSPTMPGGQAPIVYG